MLSFCLKCKKHVENINPKVSKTNKGRIIFLSKYAVYNSKKSRFIKNTKSKWVIEQTRNQKSFE